MSASTLDVHLNACGMTGIQVPMWRLSILVVLLLGCGDNPPVTYPTVATMDSTRMTLGAGDKLEIVVYGGTRQAKGTYAVDDEGTIQFQFIGAVRAAGRSPNAVQDEIQTKLADGYINEPIVAVTVVEINSRKLLVLGQVPKPGNIKFTPGMTITEAIAQSGGFSPMARKNMVRVTRDVAGIKEIYKIPVEMIAEGSRPNFPMLPGDEVFVPERPW